MSDHPDLAALADRIEAALDVARPFDILDEVRGTKRLTSEDACALIGAVMEWYTARRAARDAGYVEVLISREAVEAFKEAREYGGCNPNLVHDFMGLLARDLGDVLKGG